MNKGYIIPSTVFLTSLRIYCEQNHYNEPDNILEYRFCKKDSIFYGLHIFTAKNKFPLILHKKWIKSLFACKYPQADISDDFNVEWLGDLRNFDLCLIDLKIY